MSDLVLTLSHYHRHIAIYVVQIIDMMLLDLALGRMCLLRDLAQTCCTARKLVPFIISQDRQTQVLAAIAMATTTIID